MLQIHKFGFLLANLKDSKKVIKSKKEMEAIFASISK